MFVKLGPQKVKSSDGSYTVQVLDRYTVEYLEPERKIKIEVDFGPTVGLFRESLKTWEKESETFPVDRCDVEEVLARTKAALEFLGSQVELC